MNAIVSFCHFCELHGPNVVFCTQAFRDLPDFDALNNLDAPDIFQYQCIRNQEQRKNDDSHAWRYGRIDPDDVANTKAASGSDNCIACCSFPHNKPGYISNDDASRVSYVSSQFPLQSELYVLVRQGCIRSLSCEVCPGKEGPIYFGDEARGHVLSYTFFLRDVQARGFQRWYSILILMKDKMLLLNSWPFFVRHLRETISHLQEKASKIYSNEESKVSHRALRSAASMMDGVRKQRGQSAAGQPRSLPELVGDEKIWEYLHSSSTWLLKAGGLRLQERLVEGPQVSALIAETSDDEGINIRELSNVMGGPIFHRIVHHLLVGHQVVIRGTNRNVVSRIILSLKPLLPKQCFKAVGFSEHYIERETCNALGLSPLAKIPNGACGNAHMCVVEITANDGNQGSSWASAQLMQGNLFDSEHQLHNEKSSGDFSEVLPANFASLFNNCSFKITRESTLLPRPPQVLARIEAAVGNLTLTKAALRMYTSTIIYEWINKVKVWVHIKNRKKSSQASPERSPCQVLHPSVIFRSTSVPVLQIPSPTSLRTVGVSGSPPEAPHQDERHQLLAAIGCTEWDVPLLEFWAKNFSQG
ncbi:folliculin [Palaemon carinicauda]|uniref:folliculin n=1 Tax=Palaemon carinicauda TaxID=392227 RepID=UPI0035B597DA